MKVKSIFLLITGMLTIYGCEKDSDSFFNSFPKKYIYSTTIIKENIQMFTNGMKISDSTIIQKFVKGVGSFDLNQLCNYYTNCSMEFVNNKIIKYSGPHDDLYDTLFYIKNKEILNIKTEKIYSYYNRNSIFYKMNMWKEDSIGIIKAPMEAYDITIIALNNRYKILNNEIHIPVIGFKYSDPTLKYTDWDENEFNAAVINDLSSKDSLAIIKFEVILKQK